VCHAFLNDAKFYRFLFDIDQDIASQVQAGGCSCGGVLHSARYPRKPRGLRSTLDESYQSRLSFCCAEEGCRRRTTPPSVRFLGRRVYLGVIVVLISALAHGLSAKRRQWLIDALGVPAPTLWRWQHWWREVFAQEPWWRLEHAQFVPPLTALQLPGELLDRLRGADLRERVVRLLWLIAPQSTTAWSGCLRLMAHPQNL